MARPRKAKGEKREAQLNLRLTHAEHARITACQNLGVRGARLALGLKNNQWYRLKADSKVLENNTVCPRFLIQNGIKQQLEEFIPLERQDIVIKGLI